MHRARRLRRASLAMIAVGLLAAAGAWDRSVNAARSAEQRAGSEPQEAARAPREVRVTARKYAFSPSRIEVQENDLVKVTFETGDIPHSFTIDDDNYRIAKRATPGHPVVFEFRADKAGTFPFYCNLTTDPGCKNMHGELVVRPKK